MERDIYPSRQIIIEREKLIDQKDTRINIYFFDEEEVKRGSKKETICREDAISTSLKARWILSRRITRI